jgi:hypothetical protein
LPSPCSWWISLSFSSVKRTLMPTSRPPHCLPSAWACSSSSSVRRPLAVLPSRSSRHLPQTRMKSAGRSSSRAVL